MQIFITLLFETELNHKGKSAVRNVEGGQSTNRNDIFGNPQLSLVHYDGSLPLVQFEVKQLKTGRKSRKTSR